MTITPTASPIADAPAAHAAWRSSRLSAVTSATGNLALVETRWLQPGPAAGSAAAGSVTGSVTAEEFARAEFDRAVAAAPPTVTVTSLSRSNLDTGEPEFGLRFWDSESAAIRAFDTVTAFDYDPEWVIEATFTPVSGDRTIPFEHIRDNGGSRELVVPGDITFSRDGVDYSLGAFDDDGTLLLVFGDATNRLTGETSTYSSGRFLRVERPDGAGFGDAGPVTLDFNRAFVPPCGFSVQYNCPMPPAQNRFAVPVEAGEREVVFADGFDIYSL
jgi:uncharacterized protein (DUF1684 family)